ncbi:TonB-dependent receptor [Prolixibacteraceae bacterium Z1-6]|uniref:TonB-dependent receptor n=1 Tax=Draconibacterium aestuarii TaxID=2998507 RepID=A0A9X3F408_9BACT|nr:TonB-dependent receptor [Prolixibacteraceae bacterium Z1-6]
MKFFINRSIPYFRMARKLMIIMKLTWILLLAGMLQVSASVYSQSVKFSINLKNQKVIEVLNEIEDNSEFRFFYQNEQVDLNRRVTVQTQNASVEEILTDIFNGTDITYTIKEEKLILLVNENIVNTTKTDIQQDKIISGKVTDENGEPLPGVTVLIKGTTSGVVSNVNGEYSLNGIPEDAVLQFSFVGMKTQEVEVGSQATVNITLVADAIGIEEVVAIGYGIAKKSDLTGSVVRADLESFKEAPNTNIGVSLQGAIPGLNVGQTTSAGSSPGLSVRGRTSLSGGTSPLIVLDGIIFSGSFSEINPNDVASIDVLKDASSMAIYGAQAANGVLLITTRRGTSEKATFHYSGSYTFQSADALAMETRDEFLQKVRDVNYLNAYTEESGYLQANPDFDLESMLFDQTTKDGYNNGTEHDWWDACTQNAYIHTHQLSISGRSEKFNYYMSGSFTDQQNLIKNDNFERKTFRINLENKLTDWLTIGAQTNGSFRDLSGASPNMRMITLLNPMVSGYDSDGNFLVRMGSLTNPFLPTMNNDYDKQNSLTGNFYADIKIPYIKGLSYRLNYGNNYRWNQHYYSSEYNGEAKTGIAYKANFSRYDYTIDNILKYNKAINENNKIDVTLLYGARKNYSESTSANNKDYVDMSLGYHALELGSTPTVSSGAWEETYVYQMMRLNYNYKDKYLLTSTIRRDGSSRFASDNKIGYFPSVGGGWVISNEDFMSSVNWLDFLKFRFSYGINGNLVGRYSSLGLVSTGASYYFGDGVSTEFGREKTSLGNSSLGWERTKGINLGTDFAIYNGRLNGNIEYYKTTTNDLIYNIAIPNITGYSSITNNVGQIDNRGIEFSLTGNIVKKGDFNWEITANFSRNTNEIIALEGKDEDGDGVEDDLISSGLFIGRSIGSIYTYEIEGIYQVGDDVPKGYYLGTYKIKDQNDDGEIRPEDDRVIIGRTEPAYRFSIQNTLSYKNFTFKMFINSIQGGKDGYLAGNNPWSDGGYSGTENASKHSMFADIDYWTPSNPDAEYKIPGTNGAINPSPYKSRSFIRVQDVSLAYNFNKYQLQRFGIDGAKIYVSGKNLFTLTDWNGWDPETGQGYSTSGVPVMKAVSFGVELSF